MDAGDWIAVVALLVSFGSVYFAWRSDRAATRSAKAAERSADADHALLELETRERAQADRERRLNIWHVARIREGAWSIRLDAPVAYRVKVETHGSHVRAYRRDGGTGPMFRKDRLMVETTLAVWDRRITVVWAESADPDSELLRKPLIL